MLYQIDQTAVPAKEVFGQFWASQEAEEGSKAFAESLVRGVVDRIAELDEVISASAENWRIERMAVVDRNVLRMAVFEMLYQGATPAAVVIDEAIEVSKKFGSEASGTFINGILDAVRRRLEQGLIEREPEGD